MQREEESVEVGAVDDRHPHVQEKQAKVAMILKEKNHQHLYCYLSWNYCFISVKRNILRVKTFTGAVKIC
jgi:hypothetical protein